MTADTDAKLIEEGRKLFAGDWQFVWASPSIETLPPMAGVEVAFAGRSNVGKSSLINALTGRNALARTSHTPGRTQELIFFDGPDNAGLRLVDMPGYGYASAPKTQVASWTKLIHQFLQGRATLARVYVLIDARHGIKDVDQDVLKTLDKSAVSYQVVLTKADQVKKAELEKNIEQTTAALAKHPAAFPEVLVTSSRSGAGMPELRAAMVRLLHERADEPRVPYPDRARRHHGRRRRHAGGGLRPWRGRVAAGFRLVDAAVSRQRGIGCRRAGGARDRACENRHRGRFRLRHCGKPVRRRPDAAALCRAWPVPDGRADGRNAADRELAGAGGSGGLAKAGVFSPLPLWERTNRLTRTSSHEANPPLCALPANQIEPGPTSGMARTV